jgi:ubiquinone/menaquinone biosynthesis C-methylase UbiE
MDIEAHERSKYERMWRKALYRKHSPGEAVSELFLDCFREEIKAGDTVLDCGCGTGSAASVFLRHGLAVHLIDIAENCLDEPVRLLVHLLPDALSFTRACLWNLPDAVPPADWIYCCDVLEHVPEECVDAVLASLATRTRKGGFFQIFLQDEPFGELIGEPLHLCIRPQEWWVERMARHWTIRGVSPVAHEHRFFCLVAPLEGLQNGAPCAMT